MDKPLATFMEPRSRLALVGLLGLLVLVVRAIFIAPALVSLVVAALTAIGWCRWLETSTASGPTSVPRTSCSRNGRAQLPGL